MLRLAVLCGAMQVLSACVDGSEDKLRVARELFRSFNAHDWSVMASYYSDSAKFLDPSLGPDWVYLSRPEIQAKYRELERAIPDIQDQIVELLAVDNKVVVQFVSNGHTLDSALLMLPICSVLTIEDGKITRDATYYDQ